RDRNVTGVQTCALPIYIGGDPARGESTRHRDYLPREVEDNSVAIVRFASGALGVIDAKWGQVGPAPVRTSFHGTQGTLVNGPNGTELFSTKNPAVPEDWETLETPAGRGGGRTPEGLKGWRAP